MKTNSRARKADPLLAAIRSRRLTDLSDAALKAMSRELKTRIARTDNPDLPRFLPEAFSLAFEAIRRALFITPFDAQIEAAVSMAKGSVVELPTGEGKTVAAVFTAYLYSLQGLGVHVFTFSDFLARRDARWMRPAYDLLGVSVDSIGEDSTPQERKAAYAADVTYVTVKEAGYDYLRAFLAYHPGDIVQRPFFCAIVDEADSILLDHARIPLIVAGDASYEINIDPALYRLVSSLQEKTHYRMDAYAKTVALTDEGYRFLEQNIPDLYSAESPESLAKINLLLKAEFLLKKDVHYIVRNREIQIVDELTGRVMKDCKWPDGLQAALELKEGLPLRESESVMNRITVQSFLSLYPHLCGMSGTAASSAAEFRAFYRKSVDVIPPNKPCIRIDHPDRIFGGKKAKYDALLEKVRAVHATGQPLLIGTGSIRESEEIKALLQKEMPDIACLLNAKNDEEEAAVIAGAGKWNAVTVSTNMAGRGVDIRLGGPDGADYERVVSLGGLYVIGVCRHESARIDGQLRGRSGRQGDPGETVFYISLEDDLFVRHGIRDILPKNFPTAGQNPLNGRTVRKAVRHIQKVVEGQSLQAKISLSKYSLLYEQQRQIVFAARDDILHDRKTITDELYRDLRGNGKFVKISDPELRAALKSISLYAVNACWADYLLLLENALDEVPVIGKSAVDPFVSYNRKLIEGFEGFQKAVTDKTAEICKNLPADRDTVDLSRLGVQGPASTKTYMLLDGAEESGLVDDLAAAALSAPLYAIYMIVSFFFERRKRSLEKLS